MLQLILLCIAKIFKLFIYLFPKVWEIFYLSIIQLQLTKKRWKVSHALFLSTIITDIVSHGLYITTILVLSIEFTTTCIAVYCKNLQIYFFLIFKDLRNTLFINNSISAAYEEKMKSILCIFFLQLWLLIFNYNY